MEFRFRYSLNFYFDMIVSVLHQGSTTKSKYVHTIKIPLFTYAKCRFAVIFFKYLHFITQLWDQNKLCLLLSHNNFESVVPFCVMLFATMLWYYQALMIESIMATLFDWIAINCHQVDLEILINDCFTDHQLPSLSNMSCIHYGFIYRKWIMNGKYFHIVT